MDEELVKKDEESAATDSAEKELSRLFEGMMRHLFEEKGASLRIEIVSDKPVQDFIAEHAKALDSSFETTPMSDRMRTRLEQSDYIFSGLKTFHELHEAFPSLIDENGNRKPFERFLNDVQKIDQTYNQNYLRAEYNFCQASAQMAANWEQIEADGDRYNLQYRTAGDDKVRPEHAELDGVTLPPSDPFWRTYYPPNGWNCRCTAVQVRKSKYAETPHDEAMQRGERATAKDKRGMFQFNSGMEQKTFPDYNPYTIKRCRDCDIAKGKLSLAFVPENELCAACRLLHQCAGEEDSLQPALKGREKGEGETFSRYDDKERFEKMRIDTRHAMARNGRIKIDDSRIFTRHLFIGKSERWSLTKHAWTSDELEALAKIDQWLPQIKDGRYIAVDMSRDNWKRKMQDGIRHFVAYNLTIDGVEFVFKTAAIAKKSITFGRIMQEHPYSLKRKKDD